MVDGGGIVAVELKIGLRREGTGQLAANPAHSGLNGVKRLQRESPYRTLHHAVIGNHIRGLARADLGHREHSGIDGLGLPRDQTLKGENEMAGDQHRIHAQVGHGRMGTLAAHRNFKLIAGGHHCARVHAKFADL